MVRNILFSCFLLLVTSAFGQADFRKYFTDQTMRLDYTHAGTHNSETYYFDELLIEPYWGGSKTNLIDTMRYGKYFFEVVDEASGKVIYSRGYSTIFAEWQTVNEARETGRAFSESVVFPRPKKDVRVDFFSRNKKGILEKKFEYPVDVNSYFIKAERRLKFPAFDVHITGDPANSVDIVILPEGYTREQMGQFISDCRDFSEHLFDFAPYDEFRDKFNIRGVLAPSPDPGSDIAADSVWQNTLLNTGFYTFDSERYCMTYDFKSVRDMAANAPYDQIYILVNHPKYGGGAIYNFYSVSVNSNNQAAKIFIHELGHGFAGLGDEYYTDEVAYNEFYPLDVEPWEPNITTLVDFDSKWKNMLHRKTPVPTPQEEKYIDDLGVFEGGGYSAKGVYRPKYDCLMNTFRGDDFCPVCKRAIRQMIDFYTN
ncbi:MAG: M64 family metallopeptidase [Bacteroidales bacterium]